MKQLTARVALALAGLFTTGMSLANYPERPIRLIVPFAPGGGADLTSRVISQRLAASLGKPVVVENRPGGAGNIGTEAVARAPADGHTLLLATFSTAFNVNLSAKLPFNPLTDFEPVSLVVTVPLVVVVHPSLPVVSIQELIQLARARPGQLNYSSGGAGTANHVGGELFKHMANVQIVHVAYKGGGPALADLVGGQVQLKFATMTSTRDLIKAGRLRALATTGATRSPSAPELPTVAESGVPGYAINAWYGVLAPAGTPRPIITRLAGELAQMLRIAEVRDALLAQGNDPVGSSPEEFGRHLRDEIDKWAKVVQASGLQAN